MLCPVYVPLRQADGCCHCGSLRVAVTTSPSEVAEQLPLGCQVAPAQEPQGVTVLPPCSGSMVISPSGHAHGLHCILSGDCYNRCISGWGTVWQNQIAQVLWPAWDHSEHISVLELQAVHMALQFFLPFLGGMC